MRRLFSRVLLAAPSMALLPRGRLFASASILFGRVVPYKLADIGEGIQEVQVLEVRVKAGDRLEEFDNICAVQSDKATVDITSRYTGVVKKVHVTAGETARVGQAIIDIEVEDEEAAAPEQAAKPVAAAPAAAAPQAPAGGAKLIPFKLADIGEGIQEVQVLEVYVTKGQHVEEMERVCTVQSDKATVDITSRNTGTVANIYVQSGATFKVGAVLLDILDEGHADDGAAPAAAAGAAPAKAAPLPTGTSAAATSLQPAAGSAAQEGRKALATPATRFIAKEHNIDLAVVPATGKGGRVTKDDLYRYMNEGSTAAVPAGAAAAAAVKPATPAIATCPAAAAPPAAAVVGEYGGVKAVAGDEVVQIAGVRRGMAKTMTAAGVIPMFTFTEEFEMTNLMALRESLKGPVKRRSDGKVKLSFMPFLLKSCSMALTQFPDLNAHCPADCQVLIRKKAHNIGFAMDTPNGLIVPVVKDVANKNIFQIAEDLQTLIAKGADNRLSTADFTDGTFSISNIGAIGGIATSPVILPPQVAIVALGRTQQLPRFDKSGENVVKANVMTAGFSADHRVIDGATMVRFAVAWKRLVESPGEMVLDLR